MTAIAPRRVAATLAATLLLLCAGCDPFRADFDDVEPAERVRATTLTPAPETVDRLTVMTWNVKFGGGRIDFFFDCHGNRSLMEEEEVLENLEGLAAKIRQVDPDILVLQEVDRQSKRSDYVDEVKWLLDHTDLNHAVYASQWRADFIPDSGVGRVDTGNAILSRWGFGEATRIQLAEITEFWFAKNYFWLRRNVLRARAAVPGQDDLWVVATHSAAFSKDGTKKKHIDRFKAELDALAEAGGRVIGAGDLNALPPGTVKTSDFPDSACEGGDFEADDYSAEADWVQPLYDAYSSAIPLADYQADNTPYFSHTTESEDDGGFWNRKLDYIFTNLDVVPGSGLTHQDVTSGGVPTMPLSDHAPLSVVLELP